MNNIPPSVANALRKIFRDADEAIQRRDQSLKHLADTHGLRPADIRRITGKSDETIRRALMTPEQRETLKERRRKTKPTTEEQQ